jgi:hypothetical protein
MCRSVLVVGDLAIDRNWLISEPAADEQRYATYDNVVPRSLIEPERFTDVAGGIGTIARALGSIPGMRVYAAGAWSNEVAGRLTDKKELLPPDVDLKKAQANVDFIALADPEDPPQSTLLRHRIYTPQAVGTKLLHRFHRDPKIPPTARLLLDRLPPRDDIEMVILGDYNGALLNVPGLMNAIRNRYAGLPMVVRSSDKEVIRAYPWTILTLNVYWAAKVAEVERFDEPILRRLPPSNCTWHPMLIRGLRAIADKVRLNNKRAFVLNMEEDGALVLHRDRIVPRMLSAPDALRSLAVGGNDVFLAWLVHHYLESKEKDLGNRLAVACEDALRAAYVFSLRSKVLSDMDNYYAPRAAVSNDDLKHAPPLAPFIQESTLPRMATLERTKPVSKVLATKIPLRRDREIRLHEAGWYLDDFFTIDPEFGGTLVRLKQRLRAYVREPGARPFLTALLGEPGAGKSTLAEKLAQAVGVTPIFENVAQWDSSADLANVCERVRTAQMRHERPLVFLDEVDTKVNSELMYGKLLSPVWDGSYATHGEVRTLGTPTIFLLAGSTAAWITEAALYAAAKDSRNHPKLADLVSRFTFPVVEVPALHLRRPDIAYLVAYGIKRRFPRVEKVEEGIFRLIAQSTCLYGARSVARVIEQLERPAEKTVTNDDLPKAAEKVLSMFIAGGPRGWRQKKTLVTISQ